jgi:hypothetical protein
LLRPLQPRAAASGAGEARAGRRLHPVAAAVPGARGPRLSAARLGPTVTNCGRICFKNRKVNLNQLFAGQQVGVRQVDEHVWLVSFMHYDLGSFDDETCRLEPIENPFGPTVLPMSPE